MNKVYLIIGASSDVGCELIKKINEIDENSIIYAHYRSTINTIESIKPINGNNIIPIQADLSDDNGVNSLIDKLKELNIVPNAIVHLPAPKLDFIKFKNLSWEECEKDTYIQVASIFKILQTFLPKMVKLEGYSKVVLALSENTVNLPAKFSTKYTMSKYMLLGLMKSLTSEYQGKRLNINAISPSMIDTKLLSNIDRRMLEVSNAIDTILLPNDVVPVILSLLSDDSNLKYGENIFIPGKEKK